MNRDIPAPAEARVDRGRLEAALRSCLGPVRIARIGAKMNVRRDLDVARIFLRGGGTGSPSTVVISRGGQ